MAAYVAGAPSTASLKKDDGSFKFPRSAKKMLRAFATLFLALSLAQAWLGPFPHTPRLHFLEKALFLEGGNTLELPRDSPAFQVLDSFGAFGSWSHSCPPHPSHPRDLWQLAQGRTASLR